MLTISSAMAQEQEVESDWKFSGNLVYSSRPYIGSFRKEKTDGIVDGGMFAANDAMNLGNSNAAMLALIVQYKRFGVILNYMPTNFNGQGTALIGSIDVGQIKTSPLDINIGIRMYLSNVYYNLVQTPNMIFGLGVGFGATTVDMDVIPELLPEVGIQHHGTQPFGFLSMHMINNYNRFLYGFVFHGIKAEFSGAEISYFDYKIEFGYRLIQKRYKFDIIGGYRSVTFDAEINTSTGIAESKMLLKAPFIGVNIGF